MEPILSYDTFSWTCGPSDISSQNKSEMLFESKKESPNPYVFSEFTTAWILQTIPSSF